MQLVTQSDIPVLDTQSCFSLIGTPAVTGAHYISLMSYFGCLKRSCNLANATQRLLPSEGAVVNALGGKCIRGP